MPPDSRTLPAKEVVGGRFDELVSTLRRLDPLVRADAPDAIHQLRVTVRRLRSLLATFRRLFEPGPVDGLRDELAWLSGVLAPARDAEVMRQRLLRMIDDEPDAGRRAIAAAHVRRELGAEYDAAYAELADALESPRYVQLLRALDSLAGRPAWRNRAEKPAKKVLPKLVRRDWKRLRKRVRRADGAAAAEERARLLHDVRKAARRARYAAEVLEPLWHKPSKRLAKRLKKVQSVLGDHHDLVMARERLGRLGLDGLRGRAGRELSDLDDDFAKAWLKASRPKHRRWLH